MSGVSRYRAPLSVLASVVWLVAVAVGPVVAASPSPSAAPSGTIVGAPPPPGPPFPEPVDGQAVYDFADVFQPETVRLAEQIIDAVEAQTKAEVVLYTQALGRDDITTEEAEAHAAALMDEWGVGRAGINDGLVILFDLDTSLLHGQVQLYAGSGFADRYITLDDLQGLYESEMLPLLTNGDLDSAALVALSRVVSATIEQTTKPGTDPPSNRGVAPGPPFPPPETGRLPSNCVRCRSSPGNWRRPRRGPTRRGSRSKPRKSSRAGRR